jgi:hypothetical protein
MAGGSEFWMNAQVLFTEVRGRGVLRTSPVRSSPKSISRNLHTPGLSETFTDTTDARGDAQEPTERPW